MAGDCAKAGVATAPASRSRRCLRAKVMTSIYTCTTRSSNVRRIGPGVSQMKADGRPPFRADHVGSLLRPAKLRHAFRERAADRIGDDVFNDILDTSIS